MNVTCPACRRIYDDATCWTLCPHGPLWAGVNDYCPRCDTVVSVHGKCRHQQPKEEKTMEPLEVITSHKVNGLNDSIEITVRDQPGQGNACHHYTIQLLDESGYEKAGAVVHFQNGPIAEDGYNGISNESLLAVVEHRLLGFQSGQYACRENAIALTKLQEAMMWLHKRTRDRMARGVEGTNQK